MADRGGSPPANAVVGDLRETGGKWVVNGLTGEGGSFGSTALMERRRIVERSRSDRGVGLDPEGDGECEPHMEEPIA